jgi:hypothetical protein
VRSSPLHTFLCALPLGRRGNPKTGKAEPANLPPFPPIALSDERRVNRSSAAAAAGGWSDNVLRKTLTCPQRDCYTRRRRRVYTFSVYILSSSHGVHDVAVKESSQLVPWPLKGRTGGDEGGKLASMLDPMLKRFRGRLLSTP